MSKAITMDYELIAKALFERYETIYDINIETNKYSCFHESEAYSKLKIEKTGDDFFKILPLKVAEVIVPEDRKYVLKMLSKKNLIRGLQKEKYYSFVYRIRRDGEEIYHQIRATYQPMEDGMHIFLGVSNVDLMMRNEISHRERIRSLQQRERNHLDAVLSSAAAYMEANLTKDIMLEKSDDNMEESRQFIKKIPTIEELPKYSDMHTWIYDNLVIDNKTKYSAYGSREYLLYCFERGELRTSVTFSVYTKEGGIYPCREIFFLYKERATGDICVFCVIYDLTEQQKKEQELEELEHELQMSKLRNFTSQMQPHFLYNTLGSIQEVILMDPEYASELLGYFTVHLRSCIRAMTKDQPIAFFQELENIKAYINIEKMRFGEKLCIHYDTKVTRFPILPLTIQPLVENAIRHGIYEKGERGGDVFIRTREEDDNWIIEVKDTGVGFDVEKYLKQQKRGEGDSTGIKNIQFRLEKVMNASIEINSMIGTGTIVVIRIPKGEDKDESYNS